MAKNKIKYRPTVSDDEEEVVNVSDIVGSWGPYQRNVFIFFFIGAMCLSWFSLSLSFYAPNLTYWCTKPDIYQNITNQGWIDLTVGKKDPDYQCIRYGNLSEKCDKWEYDHSFYNSTIIDEWNIVCNRENLASFTQSSFMAGAMVSVVVMGHLSDKYGRRPIVWAGLIIELLAGLSCAFSVSITHFIISRFFLAYGSFARFETGFVLLLEMVGPEYRAVVGMAIEFGWALGFIILPGTAYLLRNFRWLQLAITLPEFALLLWCWALPESPRWQLTNNRFNEAEKAIRRAAEINGKSTELIDIKLRKLMDKSLADKQHEAINQKKTLFDLFKSWAMIKNTLIVYFSWFVSSFVYYGLSLNTNNLGGNPFINFLLAGAVEFPAYAISIYLLKRFGCRLPLTAAMFVGGIACLITIPFMSTDIVWARVTFAMIGKFCVTCSFGIMYVYSAEIFPTVVRNVGVGSSSMIGRFGSLLSPFVKELGIYTYMFVPLAIFGILSIFDGILILLLPETKGKEIPDTIKGTENFKNVKSEECVENEETILSSI